MKRSSILFPGLAAIVILAGCQTLPPGAEPGPHHTMAYYVSIEASEPGARIEANGEDAGQTPVRLKIFGNPNGTFHDFGSDYYVIRALPLNTNQFPQVRMFGTGRGPAPRERIPQRIYFDMNHAAPPPPAGPPPYAYPGYGPPPYYYYGPPYFYGPPYYYGPAFRFYFGPGFYHHRR